MADYHPLIARAVAGLEKNTGEARRALYERARTALVAQLRGVTPPLDEAEITRERLALEESIRKVEAEAARQARFENRPATVARSRPQQSTTSPDAESPPPEGAESSEHLDAPPAETRTAERRRRDPDAPPAGPTDLD